MSKELAAQQITPTERKILAALTNPESTIEVTVPKDINPQDWNSQAGLLHRVYAINQRRERSLLIAMGGLFRVAMENPEIYTEQGYESFKDFRDKKILGEMGVGRSTFYDAITAATRWGGMAIGEYEEVGRAKMRLIGQVVDKGKENHQRTKDIIEKAKGMTENELRDHFEEKGWLMHNESTGAYIRIPCSKATLKAWKKFIEDPRVQAYVGKGKADNILKSLMEECSNEWFVRGQGKIDADFGPEAVEEAEPAEVTA